MPHAARVYRFGTALGLITLGSAAVAVAGGAEPSSSIVLDPEDVAHAVARAADTPPAQRSYAVGARFVGDLNGDGRDDIAVQDGALEELHLFFGAEAWADGDGAGGPLELAAQGHATLVLPQGCRRNDDLVHFGAFGDLDGDLRDDLGVGCLNHVGEIDGDYIEGAVAVYLGRSLDAGRIESPDLWVRASPPVPDGSEVLGDKLGVEVAGVGDVDGDGYDDFAASAEPWMADGTSPVYIFRGGPLLPMFQDARDAAWRIVGEADLRCLSPVAVAGVGDVDGGGRGDLVVTCPEQPPLVDPGDPEHVPNRLDIAFNLFAGEDLAALAPGDLSYADRSAGMTGGSGLGPRVGPNSGVGDLDGDGVDDFGLLLSFPLTDDVGVRFLLGRSGSWPDIDPLTPLPPWIEQAPVDGVFALDAARADDLDGDGTVEVWVRRGEGADARVERWSTPDLEAWASSSVPPVRSAVGLPGGAVPGTPARFGFAGHGDADGDGTADLVLSSGYGGDGCSPESCGGLWVVLCRDDDGDGFTPCDGDCDDSDPSVGPRVPELCDAIDHDCDGDAGTTDGDGDGFLACAGDCDDTDPTRFPGAEEVCDAGMDLNCDGLLPHLDDDGDGAANCLDCQPFLPEMAPGLPEVCDGLDNDCDRILPRAEIDHDGDGFPRCDPNGGTADCADDDPLVGPHRFEDCANGRDDDCDGVVDDDLDSDGDGVSSCEGDCDDSDPSVFPGAPEFPFGGRPGECDGVDNDCNGVVDDPRDVDGDGVNPCQGDCDEGDPSVYAGVVGVCDGTDGNCDNVADLADVDGDGFSACAGDCDDSDVGVGSTVGEYCDRLDTNCDGDVDGEFDEDGDGWATCHGDCDDGDPDRFPAAAEPLCDDGIDGDCDLLPDAQDPDCAGAGPTSDPESRPPGVTCADCGSSAVGPLGPGGGQVLFLALVLVVGRRRRVVGLVSVFILLGGVGIAAAAPKEPGVLVYTAAQPDIRYQVEARDEVPQVDARDILHTSEFIPRATAEIEISGVSERRCTAGRGGDPGRVASSVLDLLIGLDHRGAAAAVRRALDELPCLRIPLPPRALSDLLFYLGVAEHSLGRDEAADAAFRRLLTIEPDHRGDPNFPPDIALRLEAVRESSTAPRARLLVYAPPGVDARLNGERLETDAAVSIPAGVHVLQLTRGRTTFSAEFEALPGAEAVALSSADRLRALAAPGLHPAARAFAAQLAGEVLRAASTDLLAWVDTSRGGGWQYRASIDRFSFEGELDVGRRSGRRARTVPRKRPASPPTNEAFSTGTMVEVKPARPVPEREDSLRLRVGGGMVVVAPFPYGRVGLDLGVRVVRGLHVDVGVAAGVTPTDSYGPVWLPELEVGASYRFETPVLQPRVGGAFILGVDSGEGEVAPRLGFLVRGGADIVPPGPMWFGFDAAAGLSETAFRFALSVGAGVRF